MPRPGSFFVALCMVAIAASGAVLAYVLGQVEAGASAAVGFGLLLAMVIGHLGSQRLADRAAVEAKLAAFGRTAGDLALQVEEMGRRLDKAEATGGEQAKALTQPLAVEMAALGGLVKQFAEALQVHEAAIARLSVPVAMNHAAMNHAAMTQAAPNPMAVNQVAMSAAALAPYPLAHPGVAPVMGQAAAPPPLAALVAAPPAPPPAAAVAKPVAPPVAPASLLQRQAQSLRRELRRDGDPALPEVFAGLGRADAIAIIDEAIAAKRYELFLQPIVALPQRKVRYYDASVRLRGADGGVFMPADYRALADDAGLMPALDTEILGRCIQIIRRLSARNRDVGLICGLAGSSLADAAFSADLIGSLDAVRSLAGSLMLGFSQGAVRNLSPLDAETLRVVAEKGFRFVLDEVRDLRIEPRDLADKGFRQIKVDAVLMMGRAADLGSEIHPADLAGLFARYGLDLVAGGVETEAMVVDLLDYDIRFAEGLLFSPPRPVRADVLSGAEPAASPRRPEPRAESRGPAAPQTLGQAVLASGALGSHALGSQPRDGRRPGMGSGLRALIRDRS